MGSSKSGSTTHKKSSPSKSSKSSKSKKETKSTAAATTTTASSSSSSPVSPPINNNFNGPILILDTGGDTIKHKLIPPSSSSSTTTSTTTTPIVIPTTTPNVTAKPKHQLTTLIADQIHTIKQQNQLHLSRPIERGYIVDLGTQYIIWKRIICDLEFMKILLPGSAASLLAAVAAVATGGAGGSTKKKTKKKKKRKRSSEEEEEEELDEKNTLTKNKTTPTSKCCMFYLTQPNTPKIITQHVDQIFYHDFNFGFVMKRLVQCCSAYHYLHLLGEHENETLEDKEEEKEEEEEGQNEKEDKEKQQQQHLHYEFIPTKLKNGWKNDYTKCCCVVDSGFSFTHVVPTVNACAVQNAIRRLNIGGKILTNLLKEQISYRQWNMMDDYAIVNNIKESTCFLTNKNNKFDDLMKYASKTKKGLRYFDVNYILPDFVHSFEGRVELPLLLQRKMEWEEKQKEKEERKKRMLLDKEKEDAVENGATSATNDSEMEDLNGTTTTTSTKDDSTNSTTEKSNDDDDNDKEDEKEKGKISDKEREDENNKISSKPKKKKTNKKESKNDDNDDDDDDDDDENVDSDEETQQQKLQRLHKQRQKELEQQKYIQEQEQQSLSMSVERFAIPEVLFKPSDIGLPTDICGLGETIVQSIQACDAELRAAMYHNIVLTGGNVKIPGFKERVEMEVRSLAPDNYVVRVFLPEDPVNFAWQGAHEYSKRIDFVNENCISKMQWEASKEIDKKRISPSLSKATTLEKDHMSRGMVVM